MAKTRAQKEEALLKFVADVEKSKSVIFVNFVGLKVKDAQKLRVACRQSQVGCTVLKKNLIAKGFEQLGYKDQVNVDKFDNGVALLFGFEDEVTPARLVKDLSKEFPQLTVYGGFLNSKELIVKGLDKKSVLELASLPGKQELYAKLVGSIKSPISGFVNVLRGNLSGLINVLKGMSEKK